jgi:hypothetical protein
MSMDELSSLNFERLISLSFDPLKDTLQKMVSVMNQHHSVYERVNADSSFFDSTE